MKKSVIATFLTLFVIQSAAFAAPYVCSIEGDTIPSGGLMYPDPAKGVSSSIQYGGDAAKLGCMDQTDTESGKKMLMCYIVAAGVDTSFTPKIVQDRGGIFGLTYDGADMLAIGGLVGGHHYSVACRKNEASVR